MARRRRLDRTTTHLGVRMGFAHDGPDHVELTVASPADGIVMGVSLDRTDLDELKLVIDTAIERMERPTRTE